MAQLGYHAAARRQPKVAGREVVDFDLDTKITDRSRSRGGSLEYNGLGDRHLKHFFMREAKRKDLRKAGLIDKNGNIVPSSHQKRIALGKKVQIQAEEIAMLQMPLIMEKAFLEGVTKRAADTPTSKPIVDGVNDDLADDSMNHILTEQAAALNEDSEEHDIKNL